MEHKIKHRNRKDGFYQGKKQDRGRKKVMDRSFGVCNYYQIRFKTFTCEERANKLRSPCELQAYNLDEEFVVIKSVGHGDLFSR